MTTRVRAKAPDGKESFYVYDPQSVPLGSGHTGVTYKGWEEGRTDNEVAIKVSRSASDVDMQRELEILARLYAPREPGGAAVVWGAGGQEVDVSPAAACMVMELVSGENQMSRRMNELGKRIVAGANILEKEQLATEAGRQYAQLLARMAEQGVISRGDRKATDFRLVPGKDGSERLVVLDWNRGEIIDIPALEREGRSSPEYINRRRTDLELGQTGDIRHFAHWWAEFALGRGISGALPKIDDKTDDWAALTRGFRGILVRAEAAGTARGFGSAAALVDAISRHAKNLELSRDRLLTAMAALQSQNPPTLREEMLVLIDLAERRETPEASLSGYRLSAESGGQDALIMARKALDDLKLIYIGRTNWDGAKSLIAETRRKMGEITPGTAAAHLLLLRWDVAIDVARTVTSLDQTAWIRDMWKLSDSMANLGDDSRAITESSDLLAGLSRSAAPDGLQPLRLELDLRAARDQASVVKAFGDLIKKRPDYATALRMSLRTLDGYLADHKRTSGKAVDEEDLINKLQTAAKSLFDQFIADVNAGRLPPADYQAGRLLREGNYGPKWDVYYDARARLSATGSQPPADGAAWLDALLYSMLRMRADDAAARLIDPPAAAKDALRNAADLRRRCFDRWLVQLEASATGGESRWPDEIRRAANLANTISTYGDSSAQPRADALAAGLSAAKADQDSLGKRLGIGATGGLVGRESWPAFVDRVTTAETADVDEVLREAVDKRLEMWQPPGVAEDAFDPDYPGRVAEGYRARTLLALRTAALLPKRVRAYSEEMKTLAAELEDKRAEVGNITGISRAADDYAAQMITLNRMKTQLREFTAIKDDFDAIGRRVTDAAGDIAEDRRNLELWSTKFDQLADEIDIKTRATDEVIERIAPLAQMWLVSALDQAARLELKKALVAVKTARSFIKDTALMSEANAIDGAIMQLQELSERDGGPNGVWFWLLKVRDAMRAGNRNGAVDAWGVAQSRNLDWADNRVLQRLDQRLLAMPEKPSVVDAPPAPPEPDKSGTQPGVTDGKTVPGDTTTMTQRPLSPAERLNKSKSQWAEIPRDTGRKQNSETIRNLALDTDKLIKEELAPGQLEALQPLIRNVILAFDWDDTALMNADNNYGHLYALDYKIDKLLKKAR